jgi:beta-glucanase (GH16 family)
MFDLSSYRLTFSDEFNGVSLDTATWLTRYWWGGRSLASNGELQYFADASTALVQAHPAANPFSVSDGHLTVTARPSADILLSDGQPYVSGMINSYGSFSQMYGYFEIRAQLPAGQGLWPAFWLLPADGSWPPEIDVMEMLGNDTSTYYGSVHWGTSAEHQYVTNTIQSSVDLSADFHTYGMSWSPDSIGWYLDGALVSRWDNPPEQFDQPMYLLAGLMVGGHWGGAPDATTMFPADYAIDYIRAYAVADAPVVLPETDARATAAWVKTITGGSRSDTLKGSTGNDLLDGRAGADTMRGGRGDDTYRVDSSGDRVVENVGEGIDTVETVLASYTAPANVENVTSTRSLGSTLFGNGLDNILKGSISADVLNGAGGADILFGGEGGDLFVLRAGETAGDRVMDFAAGDQIRFEGFGSDAVVMHHQGDIWSISGAGAVEVFWVAGVADLSQGTDYVIG